jgi:hypothetical protein
VGVGVRDAWRVPRLTVRAAYTSPLPVGAHRAPYPLKAMGRGERVWPHEPDWQQPDWQHVALPFPSPSRGGGLERRVCGD